ncbi:MAG: hypothetical protein ACE14S_00575 [Candidatus Bathyarchaeia archaeon]
MTKPKPEVLANRDRGVEMRRKWVRTWEKVGERILQLPAWMQNIILEDVNTAVVNRVALMETIQNAQRKR